MKPFVHLHVHTQYSMLDGQASIDSLIEKAQKDGMPAIAITDHGAAIITESPLFASKKTVFNTCIKILLRHFGDDYVEYCQSDQH